MKIENIDKGYALKKELERIVENFRLINNRSDIKIYSYDLVDGAQLIPEFEGFYSFVLNEINNRVKLATDRINKEIEEL